MAAPIRIGIIGAGWPGGAHARGYQQAGGFKVQSVCDLIPERRAALAGQCPGAAQSSDFEELIRDKTLDALSLCLPTHLHAAVTIAALRAGKHVVCETPPALSVKEVRSIEKAASKAGKVVLFGFQRRFGGAEQAARQALDKGYFGAVASARVQWLRTRGIPAGTGWYTRRQTAGGGALIDLGSHMLDLGWFLLGEPAPITAFASTTRIDAAFPRSEPESDVETSAVGQIRFQGGKMLELAVSWWLNQPPQQNGTLCRLYGLTGGVDVYTPAGAVGFRGFDAKGNAKPTPLKPPKMVGHASMMRHFKECIGGSAQPRAGIAQARTVMSMIEALYRSAESGKSVEIKPV